jgi:hypothetical protein
MKRLVAGERLGCCSRVVKVDVAELLPVAVFRDEGGANILD